MSKIWSLQYLYSWKFLIFAQIVQTHSLSSQYIKMATWFVFRMTAYDLKKKKPNKEEGGWGMQVYVSPA